MGIQPVQSTLLKQDTGFYYPNKGNVLQFRRYGMEMHGSMNQRTRQTFFVKNFDMKAQLLAESVDCPFFGRADIELAEVVVLRSRRALKLLASLDESKATGPDHIPASILKRIAKEICVPFTILCRRLLQEAC